MLGYELPVSIQIDGIEHPITNKGDYRMILDCFIALADEDILESFKIIDCLKIFYEEINIDDDVNKVFGKHSDEAIKQMYSFFNCFQEEIGMKTNHKLIDWEQDAQLVCAAVNNVAQTEIRSEPYLHWFTFMGYYMSIGESVLSEVINIRHKKAKGKKLEKHEREFMNNNPQYFVTRQSAKKQQEAKDIYAELLRREKEV